jgi:hypothetical protein
MAFSKCPNSRAAPKAQPDSRRIELFPLLYFRDCFHVEALAAFFLEDLDDFKRG